ncbi:MAG: hypothetical protein KKI02_09545 [Planctomycetes bacterium]|nr:hypothetical protein [Planctomycetota bacterium]
MSQPPTLGQHAPSPQLTQLGWRGTLAVALAVLVVHAGTTRLTGRTTTPQVAYFDHLAAAFLDGRLYLEDPPGDSDLTLHDDRWYVPFPPLAAVLMIPWVAAFGIEGTNTVVFSMIFGTINILVLAHIFDALARRGWIQLSVGGRCWLLALFAFGCVHWQVALEGSVWFLSHTCTVTFIALAVWAAVATRSPWLPGIALAIALWGRPNVVFTWPLLLGILAQQLQDAAGHVDRRRLITWAWCSTAPLAISIAGLMSYNYARFHDPFDFGYATQNVSAAVRGDLARGQFHIFHLPRNLHTMLMGPPRWYEPENLPHVRLPIPDAHGMSIFLTTPALFYLVRARRRRDLFVRGAWLATGLLLIPLLLYYNTGWRQFGYRFSLDFMIPLMILLAVATGRRTTWPMRTLILLGVVINAWGVVWWYTNWLD